MPIRVAFRTSKNNSIKRFKVKRVAHNIIKTQSMEIFGGVDTIEKMAKITYKIVLLHGSH